MTAYEAAKRRARDRLKGPIRSIYLRRGRSVFSSLYLARTGNHGQFCRAPRTEKS